MQNWQKERNEKLLDLFFGTHIVAYLITISTLSSYKSVSFSFGNYIIFSFFLIVAATFILLDYYFHNRVSKNEYLKKWNIIKYVVMLTLITVIFIEDQGKLLGPFIIIYMLPVILACISLGRNWGFIFAGAAVGIILVLLLNQNNFLLEQQVFEIGLVFTGVIFLVAWFLGSIIEVEKITTNHLAKMASHDDLTGLPNHRSFQEQLQTQVDLAFETQSSFSLILIDIDFFKVYNDSYGHTQGDLLLKEISNLFIKKVPSHAVVARYGGEEFAIILPNASEGEAIIIAESLRQAVLKHEFSGEICLPYEKLTISVGIASMPKHGKNKQELLEAADEALYSSKFTGRNKVRTYLSVLERLGQAAGDNDKELINSLRTLMTVINAKDKYTYGHSDRVAYYAKLIGVQLKMTEEKLRMLEFGSFLHDLGKVEIPREILNKKGSLSQGEWNIMKQHSCWGAEMIKSSQTLKSIVPMVLYHHENYDGSGYPEGIKGEDIPLFARVLRVVDSFDAMTTYRPYHKPFTKEDALKDIYEKRGSFYDPEIVDAFIAAINKEEKVR
ncbi:diguanylate cyclase (GGDEF)-like protein [Desulfitispora alkaliphila]|uniref:bifunctional diguanylate cyclase/phosphohydrolase n=1 Tax=Desulfitispora alkaliphila TaxID=622674 RepID=UPI003D21CEFD